MGDPYMPQEAQENTDYCDDSQQMTMYRFEDVSNRSWLEGFLDKDQTQSGANQPEEPCTQSIGAVYDGIDVPCSEEVAIEEATTSRAQGPITPIEDGIGQDVDHLINQTVTNEVNCPEDAMRTLKPTEVMWQKHTMGVDTTRYKPQHGQCNQSKMCRLECFTCGRRYVFTRMDEGSVNILIECTCKGRIATKISVK